MRWRAGAGAEGGLLFDAGATGRPSVVVDGDGVVAQTPVEMLLVAAATCSASDVVLILQKQRVALEALEVRLRGTRREEQRRRDGAPGAPWLLGSGGGSGTALRWSGTLCLRGRVRGLRGSAGRPPRGDRAVPAPPAR